MRENKKINRLGEKLAVLALSFLMVFSPTISLADEVESELPSENVLYEPIEKQIIQLSEEGSLADWNISALETFGLKLLIRAKEFQQKETYNRPKRLKARGMMEQLNSTYPTPWGLECPQS